MAGQSAMLVRVLLWLDQAGQVALGWLSAPVDWSQFGFLGLACPMALLWGLIVGSLLYWFGTRSNRQSADFIKTRPEPGPATRELAIFGAAFCCCCRSWKST